MSIDVPARDFAAIAAEVALEANRLIALYPPGQARSALLPILHAFQDVEGWVSPEALAQCAAWIDVPLSVVESTASFYTLFHRKPVGRYMLQPCRNLSCAINGAGAVMKRFREKLGIGHLQTTDDGIFSYEEAECLAACNRAPCMQVNLEFVYDLTVEKVDALVDAMRAGTFEVAPLPQSTAPGRDWHVSQEATKKSPGAQGVSNPNNTGGYGDASGTRMIERLARDSYPVDVRPTSERLVGEGKTRLSAPPSTSEH